MNVQPMYRCTNCNAVFLTADDLTMFDDEHRTGYGCHTCGTDQHLTAVTRIDTEGNMFLDALHEMDILAGLGWHR